MVTLAQSPVAPTLPKPRLPKPTVPPGLVRQAVRFSAIGIGCAVVGLGLFAVLREWFDAQAANVLASLLVTVVNTAANRRFTFGIRDTGNRTREQLQGLVLFAASLSLSSGGLWLLDTLSTPSRPVEIAVLAGANLLGGLLRFAFLRSWVFRAG